MRILWHSNAPWVPTGYGNQVGLFAHGLAERHELAVSAFYGLEGARLNWNGIQVFPGLGGEYGNVCLEKHAESWFRGDVRGGLVLTLIDVWVLNPQMAQTMNFSCWVPVDHEPVPPDVRNFFTLSGAIPICMTEYGRSELEQFDPLYVPHGVDLDTFAPRDDRDQVRERVGLNKDDFVVGIVAANKGRPSRKSFQQSLEAFGIFRQAHENAVLYLHTVMSSQHTDGVELTALIEALGIGDSVRIADQYRMILNPQPPEAMSQVYSTFDVLLNPSTGEGFGVPIVEAQACGVPVITTDHSAMKEVTGAGWKVGGTPYWTGQRSYQKTPFVPDIVDALEECYSLPTMKRKALSTSARQFAGRYGRDTVLRNHFLPALAEIEERIGEQPTIKMAA